MGVTNHLLTGMILQVRIQVCPDWSPGLYTPTSIPILKSDGIGTGIILWTIGRVFWGFLGHHFLLVISTHLKHISQMGNLPQIGVTIKNIWNHHLDFCWSFFLTSSFFRNHHFQKVWNFGKSSFYESFIWSSYLYKVGPEPSYKWGYSPSYPFIRPFIGVITPFITGDAESNGKMKLINFIYFLQKQP